MDGTIADYTKGWQGMENIGDPIPGARDFLVELSSFSRITIWTTRGHVDKRNPQTAEQLRGIIETWLIKWDMPFDDIFVGQGKPHCQAIVDDRAVPCDAQNLHQSIDALDWYIPQPQEHYSEALIGLRLQHKWSKERTNES